MAFDNANLDQGQANRQKWTYLRVNTQDQQFLMTDYKGEFVACTTEWVVVPFTVTRNTIKDKVASVGEDYWSQSKVQIYSRKKKKKQQNQDLITGILNASSQDNTQFGDCKCITQEDFFSLHQEVAK